MVSKFAKMILTFVVTAAMIAGCSEKKDSSTLNNHNGAIVYGDGCTQMPLNDSLRGGAWRKQEREQNELLKNDEILQKKLVEEKKHDQAKFDKASQCLLSQKVDFIKDSVRFKSVFDSCWAKFVRGASGD